MMTGPEHYQAAERLLAGTPKTAEEYAKGIEGDNPWPPSAIDLAAASVHATLALAAATALASAGNMPIPDRDAWEAAVTAGKD